MIILYALILLLLLILLQYLNILPKINNLYKSIVFHPPKENFYDTSYSSNKNYHFVKSKNGKLTSYFEFRPENDYNKIIIWSHGNAMNAYQMSEYFTNLATKLNVLIIAYDYQGYGISEGNYSEQNCYDDLESIVDHIMYKYNVDTNQICLIGHSLGTGVVMDYVSKHEWQNPVMLISPYQSIIRIQYSWIGNFLGFMDMFNTYGKLNNIKCPVKIIHGKNDTLININHSYELYDKLINKSESPLWIDNCGHNDIIDCISPDVFSETFSL